MIGPLLALTLSAATKPPRVNDPCLGAPVRLVTDNVPVGSDVATSVVNIWGFRDVSNNTAVAWLYKNHLGAYYIQFNYKEAPGRFDGIPLWRKILAQPTNGVYMPLVKITQEELIAIENALIAKGVTRSGCFSKDIVMPKG